MTRAKDISKIVTDADLSGTLDVTGAVTVGGLTVDGSAVTSLTLNTNVNGSQIAFDDGTSGTQPWQVGVRNNGSNDFLIYQSGAENIDIFTNNALRQTISSGGDISFYEDTGTTPKLFWDASEESLGIGTSSPYTLLELSSTDPILRFNDSNGGTDTKNFEIRYVGTSSPDIDGLYFRTVNDANSVYSDKMVVLGSGNVGIGTSSPDRKFHIETADNIIGLIESTDADAWLAFKDNTSSTDNAVRVGATGDNLRFYAGSGERMRITDGGNVLVGKTSADATGSKIELASEANSVLAVYMIKKTQVEMTMGFKASTDTNFYIGTGSSNVGTNGVYLANTGTSWISNSDFRKKKNLVAIDNALDKIANCRAMTGHFNNEEDDVKKRPFLIAQDWLIALPEAVDENTVDDDGNENLGLSYEGTIPLLVACIKELREENIDLKARIVALETA